MAKNNELLTQKKFNTISIGLSSPEVILGNSRGEVQTLSKESTINIVNTLIKALKTSSALRFTILAGVFYHIVLGASGFEQLWLVQERGFEKIRDCSACGMDRCFCRIKW